MAWGTPQEVERRRRILIAVWAYAYEMMNDQLVGDDIWERECLAINLDQETGDDSLDFWFSENFDPSTGQWVHDHPNKDGLHKWYLRMSEL
jgi:hypothetical protein